MRTEKRGTPFFGKVQYFSNLSAIISLKVFIRQPVELYKLHIRFLYEITKEGILQVFSPDKGKTPCHSECFCRAGTRTSGPKQEEGTKIYRSCANISCNVCAISLPLLHWFFNPIFTKALLFRFMHNFTSVILCNIHTFYAHTPLFAETYAIGIDRW